ncbi:MAG: DEAD/DEAH box helicase [Kiritimatiellae bacterium]|nr:DEAD/DEAH box helicase [Kiritimatiellia bacterium]
MPVPQAFDYTPGEIRAWGDRASCEAGEKAAERGFVTHAEYDPATRTASGVVNVNGSSVKTSFTVRPSRTVVDNKCPCPASQKRGLVCFHMLAVAWTLQKRAAGARRDDKRAAEAEHARRVAEALARGESVERDLVRGAPVSLRLAVPRDWAARFADGSVPLELSFVRTDRPDDPPRPVAEYVASRTPVSLSEADDNVLFILEDIAEGSLLRPVRLAPAYFVWILDTLGKLGRPLFLERGAGALEVRGAADAVPSHLLASFDAETGEVLLALNTEIPGVPEGTVPDYLVFGNHGYAFHAGTFWPLKAVLPVLYQKVYADTIAIPRIGTRRFLEHELPALRGAFDVRCEFDPDLFSWTPAQPAFRLAASATNGAWPLTPEKIGVHTALRLSLKAVYPPAAPGGAPVEVEAAGPAAEISIPVPDDPYAYFVRNVEAERAALASLPAFGIAGEDGARDGASMRGSKLAALAGEEALLSFLATTVPQLESRDGWSVSLEGPLAALSMRYDRVAVVVHAADALGVAGAFDLGFSYKSASYSHGVSADDVAIAKNRGRPWIADRRGRPVLFDLAALEALDRLEGECGLSEIADPGALRRVDAVHAPFVLAAVDRLARSGVVFDKASAAWVARTRKALAHDPDAEDHAVVQEPLRSTLRPYQRTGVAWLRWLERNRLAGILADEMGLGKTVQTLAWLALPRFHEADRGLPALVVCPTSLVENWAHEARQFTPDLRVLLYAGPDRAALRERAAAADLVVTSYAILRRDSDWLAATPFSAVVLDEAQNIKNQRTQSAQAAKLLQAGSRLVLTGTPIENSLADLWSIMDFLRHGYLGAYDEFRADYEVPVSLLGDPAARPADRLAAQRALDRLRDKVRPFLLRRLKADVAKDLPAKIVQNSWPELTADQRRVYDKYWEAARGQISEAIARDGFEKSRMVVLTALLRLRQVCCDLRLLGDANPLPDSAAPSGKTEQLLEILEQARDGGHRTLVFSQFVEMLKLLRAELDARGVPYCYIDGSSTDRLETVHRFNTDPSIPVFLISLKAGGTGLNLVGADEVVLFDPWWNPSIEDQAIDRAHRIGQKRTVHAFKLITPGTVEEKVLAMQRRKRSIIAATVGGATDPVGASLTADDVRQLFELD